MNEKSFKSVSHSIQITTAGFLLLLSALGCAQADEFADLAQRCAPSVAVDTLRAIVKLSLIHI